MMILLPPLLLLAVAATSQPPPSPKAAPVVPRRTNRLFISPIGEPFRPSGPNDDTLADWFHQADFNHDGQLTLDEMEEDATRFFATLDVGKDGEIDPDDITRYENEVAPEIQAGSGFNMARGSRDDGHVGASRFGLLDLPEPVVSADADFNRGVSLTEFRAAAQQRFIALDVDHHGWLSLAELEHIRPAPAAKNNPPPEAPMEPYTPPQY